MIKEHPLYMEGTVGTGEQVWKGLDGKPTLDKTQRAWANAVGNLVSPSTEGAKPTPAIGWKVNLTNPNGTTWSNPDGKPGWTTYAKYPDIKAVFAGKEYPTSLPKVARTIRDIRKEQQNPADIIEALRGTPEKLGNYLLANIVHNLGKWLPHGPGYTLEIPSNETTLEVINGSLGETTPGIQIKQGKNTYKIIPRGPYDVGQGRARWSVYIDDSGKNHNDLSEAKNFKLLPEGEYYFTAKICLDAENYSPLAADNISLLESINTLLESIPKQRQ